MVHPFIKGSLFHRADLQSWRYWEYSGLVVAVLLCRWVWKWPHEGELTACPLTIPHFLPERQVLLEEPNGKQSTWEPLNIVHVGQPPGQIVAWRWVDSTCKGQIIVWNTSFLLKERSFFWKTCSPEDNISLVSSSREDIPPICRTLVFKWLLNEWIRAVHFLPFS